MTTFAKIIKSIVVENIDKDYIKECGFERLGQVYHAEFGNYRGISQQACKDYLQGLPSVCTIPFYNGEILETLKAKGWDIDRWEAHDLIERYWLQAGGELMKIIFKENRDNA